jgi:hypothetical protein
MFRELDGAEEEIYGQGHGEGKEGMKFDSLLIASHFGYARSHDIRCRGYSGASHSSLPDF